MKTKLMILFLLVSLVMGTAVQVASDASQLAIPRLVVNTSFLNVRTGPGPQYAVVVIVVGGLRPQIDGKHVEDSPCRRHERSRDGRHERCGESLR